MCANVSLSRNHMGAVWCQVCESLWWFYLILNCGALCKLCFSMSYYTIFYNIQNTCKLQLCLCYGFMEKVKWNLVLQNVWEFWPCDICKLHLTASVWSTHICWIPVRFLFVSLVVLVAQTDLNSLFLFQMVTINLEIISAFLSSFCGDLSNMWALCWFTWWWWWWL